MNYTEACAQIAAGNPVYRTQWTTDHPTVNQYMRVAKDPNDATQKVLYVDENGTPENTFSNWTPSQTHGEFTGDVDATDWQLYS